MRNIVNMDEKGELVIHCIMLSRSAIIKLAMQVIMTNALLPNKFKFQLTN